MLAAIARTVWGSLESKPVMDPQTGFVLLVGWAVALAATLT